MSATDASLRWAAAAVCFASVALAAGQPQGDAPRPLMYNLDSTEFFVGTFGAVEAATIDRFVDSFAGTAVTDLLICVNAQRTNFRSAVWEAEGDGYDPTLGDDQPFFAGIAPDRAVERSWYRDHYRWMRGGADYPARMLAAARRNHIRGWISIRMNDSHYPDQSRHPYHSSFWRQHPEWYLENRSLDYLQPEVREHYLKLIREVAERYDLSGLELDFMRHGRYFRPNQTQEGRLAMNQFLREVRAVTSKASARLGRPVQLGVRVPTRPWIAAERGLDAVAWAREGLIDMLVAAPWWSSTQTDVPVEEWKGLLQGTPVAVAVSLEDGLRPDPKAQRRTISEEEMRGAMLSFLSRGVDAAYLFNWFTGPLHEWSRDAYRASLMTASSAKLLAREPRRHPVTLVDPWAEGEPGSPTPLRSTSPTMSLRIHIGPAPAAEDSVFVRLGVASGSVPLRVRFNGRPCRREGKLDGLETYRVPAGGARGDYNLVQVETGDGTALEWAEVRIVPAK